MDFLKLHDWPGNIRELQNFIERAVVLSPGSVLRPMLTELKEIKRNQLTSGSRTLAAAERDHILEVLHQTDWLIGGQQGAAARLGLPRTTLIHKMVKLGIEHRRSQRRRLVTVEPKFAAISPSAAFAAA
jgi:formate hydrogenlyase transcriptional activator